MRPAVAMLLVLALAGCLGSGGGGGGGGSSNASTTSHTSSSSSTSTTSNPTGPPIVDLLLAFALAPCRGISVVVPQPLADVQALLPDGFVAAPAEFVPGGGTGVVAVDLYACENLTTPFTAVPATFYGQVYTLIEAPTDQVPHAPNVDVHEYVFRLLAAQDILATLWPRAGYDTVNGSVNVSVGSPAPLPLDPGFHVGQGNVGDAYFLMAQGQPDAAATLPGDASFARYTLLADSSVLLWTGEYDVTSLTGGQGVLQVPAGDPFAAFETPAGTLHGVSRLYRETAMLEMDLRRIFYPPA